LTARIIEIIDVQTFLSQQMLNVYHFVDPAGTGDEATLVSTYISDVIPKMATLQNVGCVHNTVKHRQVYPTTTLLLDTNIPGGIAGADSGTAGDSFDALSFKWILGSGTVVLAGGFTGHIKRGGTRVGGMNDGVTFQNTVNSIYVTAGHTFTTELLLPGTGPYQLCVASFLDGARVKQTTVQSYAIVTDASDAGASTQNSRKFLRGRAS
jgi:hypothetical protein